MELVKYDAMCKAIPITKTEWINNARKTFKTGNRSYCYICGRYTGITEAHHITPLSDQYDMGHEQPDHDFEWLCPNHHALIHRLMGKHNHSEAIICMDRSELRSILCLIGTL